MLLTFALFSDTMMCHEGSLEKSVIFFRLRGQRLTTCDLLTANDEDPDSCLPHSMNAGQKCTSIIVECWGSSSFR